MKHAVNRLRRAPGFATLAVSTLAIGVGACALMFNIVSAVLLAPVPFRDAQRIVMIWGYMPQFDLGFPEQPISGREFSVIRDEATAFQSVAAFRARPMNLGDGAAAERVDAVEATGDFFTTLGVAPQMGRFFTRANETAEAKSEVVISDGLWRRRFGANRRIVGAVVDLDGVPYTVVAVAPPSFSFPRGAEMPGSFQFPARADAWIPLEPPVGGPSDLAVVGRMRPGVTIAAAGADLDRVRIALEEMMPRGKGFFGTMTVPLRTQLVGKSARLLLSLLAAVGVLLLIACGNAAQLQVARLLRRRHELAIRAAIGASARRTAFGSVAEMAIIAAVAGAFGTALAYIGFRALASQLSDKFPRVADAAFDWRVAGAALGLTTAMALLAGGLSAWTSTRTSLMETMRRGGRGLDSSGGAERIRRMLIGAQLTLAVVLVALAGLTARSLAAELASNLGFNATHGLTFEVSLPAARYPEKQGGTYMEHPAAVGFITAALDRMRSIPGVAFAAIGKPLPLSGSQEATVFTPEGLPVPKDPAATRIAEYTVASPDMLHALGTPLLAGRDFNATDRDSSLRVVIVNRSMAAWLWPGQTAVGKRLHLGGASTRAPWMTVVGVAADLKRYALTDSTRPEMIVPYTQQPYPTFGTMQFVVRTRLPAAGVVGALQQAISAVDPSIPIARVRTIDALVGDATANARFVSTSMAEFGAGALLLAVIGLYGVIAYSAQQRRQEFGIRRALGASRSQLLALVVREALRLTLVAIVIGEGAAFLAGHAIRSLLYAVAPYDALTTVATVVVLAIATVAACVGPAWKAAGVDPRVALSDV